MDISAQLLLKVPKSDIWSRVLELDVPAAQVCALTSRRVTPLSASSSDYLFIHAKWNRFRRGDEKYLSQNIH